MYGAVMYTANILGLKKKKCEDYDVFFVTTDINNGWNEMVSRHRLVDDVQRTEFRRSQFVGLDSINPRAADALHGDVRSTYDMIPVGLGYHNGSTTSTKTEQWYYPRETNGREMEEK